VSAAVIAALEVRESVGRPEDERRQARLPAGTKRHDTSAVLCAVAMACRRDRATQLPISLVES